MLFITFIASALMATGVMAAPPNTSPDNVLAVIEKRCTPYEQSCDPNNDDCCTGYRCPTSEAPTCFPDCSVLIC